jgi:hypothetical protein
MLIALKFILSVNKMLTTFIALSRKITQICVENNCVFFDRNTVIEPLPFRKLKNPP